jgi:hypothetical protein
MDRSDLELLRAMLGESSTEARERRIRALSDLELIHAVELLCDETVIQNVPSLDLLRAECGRRGLASTLKH